MADDRTVHALVELIYSGELQRRSRLRELSPYWRWLTGKVPREEIESCLLASDRTERGIFEAFLRIYADRRGKAIIGEKTPAHLAYVETLLDWFPDGRVIHCLRDPRASSSRSCVGEAGFDQGAAERWRSHISPGDKSAMELLLGRRLGEMGYRE